MLHVVYDTIQISRAGQYLGVGDCRGSFSEEKMGPTKIGIPAKLILISGGREEQLMTGKSAKKRKTNSIGEWLESGDTRPFIEKPESGNNRILCLRRLLSFSKKCMSFQKFNRK